MWIAEAERFAMSIDRKSNVIIALVPRLQDGIEGELAESGLNAGTVAVLDQLELMNSISARQRRQRRSTGEDDGKATSVAGFSPGLRITAIQDGEEAPALARWTNHNVAKVTLL